MRRIQEERENRRREKKITKRGRGGGGGFEKGTWLGLPKRGGRERGWLGFIGDRWREKIGGVGEWGSRKK